VPGAVTQAAAGCNIEYNANKINAAISNLCTISIVSLEKIFCNGTYFVIKTIA
jgi:hypothetical protein